MLTLEETHFKACEAEDLERLKHLLDTYDHNASTRKRSLEKAAEKNKVKIMRYRLDSDLPIEIDSWTAWYVAWGGLDAYRLLHSKYPDIIW